MLLALILACSPGVSDKALDTGDITLDSPGWTPMGCDVDGIYPWGDIEEQAGPQPWMLSAWLKDGDVWVEEGDPKMVEEYELVQVFWSFDPEPNECGLWVLALG